MSLPFRKKAYLIAEKFKVEIAFSLMSRTNKVLNFSTKRGTTVRFLELHDTKEVIAEQRQVLHKLVFPQEP